MSRNAKRLLIAVLAIVMTSLTGMSVVQVSADPDLALLAPDSGSTGMFDICNNRFTACGGLQVCPSGCHCGQIGAGSQVCLNN